MSTIYWLAVFGAVVGIGMFVLSLVATCIFKYSGNPLEQAVIEIKGIAACLRWKYLLVGIASLIVVLTI